MPSVSSIQLLDNGFQINWTSTLPLRLERSDIPGNVRNKTPAVVEAWINDWLDDQLGVTIVFPGDPDSGKRLFSSYVRVHVITTNPLKVEVRVSNTSIPINWTSGGL